MAFARAAGVVLIGLTVAACSSPTASSADPINGTYILQNVSGAGPATGSLILTRQGYAERRVRFMEPNGTLSQEYLARGTATVMPDNTIALELREMGVMAGEPWRPDARLIDGAIEIRHPDVVDGPVIVETYRRK